MFRRIRRRLRGCRACRVVLAEFREVPWGVAALAALAAGLAVESQSGFGGFLTSSIEWCQERADALALKLQAATEVTTTHKVATVAASTAVLAGSGVGAVKSLEPRSSEAGARDSARANLEERRYLTAGVRCFAFAVVCRGEGTARGRVEDRPRRRSATSRANARRAERRARSTERTETRGEFSSAEPYLGSQSVTSQPSSSQSSPGGRQEFGSRVESAPRTQGSSQASGGARTSSSGSEFGGE